MNEVRVIILEKATRKQLNLYSHDRDFKRSGCETSPNTGYNAVITLNDHFCSNNTQHEPTGPFQQTFQHTLPIYW